MTAEDQRVGLVTLCVDDLEQARSFHEALGRQGQPVQETASFQAGGLVVVLWSRARLDADSGVPMTPASAGATVTRAPAASRPGGAAHVVGRRLRDPHGPEGPQPHGDGIEPRHSPAPSTLDTLDDRTRRRA